MSDTVSLLSLFMVVVIIGAQRHEEQLAQRRGMLLLELAVRSEQKIAKVIALIEESRRDTPSLPTETTPAPKARRSLPIRFRFSTRSNRRSRRPIDSAFHRLSLPGAGAAPIWGLTSGRASAFFRRWPSARRFFAVFRQWDKMQGQGVALRTCANDARRACALNPKFAENLPFSWRKPMLLSTVITPYLPYLRRFARALSGSQSTGDACVAATLEALLANPAEFDQRVEPQIALYRLFLRKMRGAEAEGPIDIDYLTPFRKLSALPEQSRIAFLLNAMEDFSIGEVAQAMEVSNPVARAFIDQAGREIAAQLRTHVLIIEDEPLIALDLQKLLQQLGHKVATVARTRDAAVRAARELRPGLILSDIMLADGSSGLDAINDILPELATPVIFITAFPQAVLTGRAPEPAFLIAKPFSKDAVKAVISQALFFDQKCRAAGSEDAPSAPLPVVAKTAHEDRAEEL
jgi:CheY-like chemotaxis protein/DNA-directed RNA polymerase specialized sigma24 family protein